MGLGQLAASREIANIKQNNQVNAGSMLTNSSNPVVATLNDKLKFQGLLEKKVVLKDRQSPKNVTSSTIAHVNQKTKELISNDTYKSTRPIYSIRGLSPEIRSLNTTPQQHLKV